MTQERALTLANQVCKQIESKLVEYEKALPRGIDAKRFLRVAQTTVRMNKLLLEADVMSLHAAIMNAAQDGLMIDGRECALVVFRSKDGAKVQYIPMIRGILKQVRNSGEIACLSANVAYEKDHFDYMLGDDEYIKHKPHMGVERGNPIACYAIAKTKDGAIYREVMSVHEIEKVRMASKTGKFGPWADWWEEMAKKTVLKRLAKLLPSSADSNLEPVTVFNIDEEPHVEETPVFSNKSESRLKRSMKAVGDDVIDAEVEEQDQKKDCN